MPQSSRTAPASLAAIADRVEQRLITLIELESARWAQLDPELARPYRALADLTLAGGKRLRPAFCTWAFVAAGGDADDPAVVGAGAAFEMLHAFALFHDDVMDGSSTRRGQRTVHLEYERRHHNELWRGEGRRFGEGVAILVGDLAFVYADLLMTGAPPPAISLWHELRIELNIGQYLDMMGTASGDVPYEGAMRIARLKSGKYTVERPMHLGAALANRLDLIEPFSAYALPLGDAFQLRDDVLGVFGDEESTGKPVGDDLREGKPTPMLAIAMERANEHQRHVLDRIGCRDLSVDEVGAIQRVLIETGALDAIEDTIAANTIAAIEHIEMVDIAPDAQQAFVELAQYVAWRDK